MLENFAEELERTVEDFADTATFTPPRDSIISHRVPNIKTHAVKTGRWVTVSNVQRSLTTSNVEVSVSEEVQECFQIVRGWSKLSVTAASLDHSSFVERTSGTTQPRPLSHSKCQHLLVFNGSFLSC